MALLSETCLRLTPFQPYNSTRVDYVALPHALLKQGCPGSRLEKRCESFLPRIIAIICQWWLTFQRICGALRRHHDIYSWIKIFWRVRICSVKRNKTCWRKSRQHRHPCMKRSLELERFGGCDWANVEPRPPGRALSCRNAQTCFRWEQIYSLRDGPLLPGKGEVSRVTRYWLHL